MARKAEQVILAIEQRREAVLEVIRSARRRLLISVFRCTDVPVLDAIADALQREVEVRLLITPRARGWEKRLKELGAYLESMGAKVHPYSDPVVKYHAKYLLADDGPALIGSLNLTAKCFGATCDFILISHDAAIVSGLKELFEVDWLAPHSTLPTRENQRLIIGPERARAQFTALLGSARRSIQIIDHKLNDPAIQALLKLKKAQGVDVEVLASGQLGGLLPHGKLIIVDGRKAAFGSMALSALSLDFRREIAVIVEDTKCVRKLKEFFRLLASGREVMDPEIAATYVREKDGDN
ncbi:MAG: phospholipase D-like domain-containing protein [Candidatus Solibacter sp.]|nr:phospholipase D-like domain-containing protein [Candidatus Solibacter sp.]